MNLEETIKVLSVYKLAYPNAYNRTTENEAIMMSKLWQSQFNDYEFNIVWAGINSEIATNKNGYPASIGQIKDIITNLINDSIDTNEVWLAVRKALRNSCYNSHDEFEKLDPITQQLIGNPRELNRLGQCSKNDLKFYQIDFIKRYNDIIHKKKEMKKIPNKIKGMVGIETKPQLTLPAYKRHEKANGDIVEHIGEEEAKELMKQLKNISKDDEEGS